MALTETPSRAYNLCNTRRKRQRLELRLLRATPLSFKKSTQKSGESGNPCLLRSRLASQLSGKVSHSTLTYAQASELSAAFGKTFVQQAGTDLPISDAVDSQPPRTRRPSIALRRAVPNNIGCRRLSAPNQRLASVSSNRAGASSPWPQNTEQLLAGSLGLAHRTRPKLRAQIPRPSSHPRSPLDSRLVFSFVPSERLRPDRRHGSYSPFWHAQEPLILVVTRNASGTLTEEH